jgi:hypothetical protein
VILSAILSFMRPPRTPDEAMRKSLQLMRMARWVFLLNMGALVFTLTLIALLKHMP